MTYKNNVEISNAASHVTTENSTVTKSQLQQVAKQP